MEESEKLHISESYPSTQALVPTGQI